MPQNCIQSRKPNPLLKFSGIGGCTLNPRLLFPDKLHDSNQNLSNNLK